MIDIWGRPLSAKPTTEKGENVKKIIEDEIAEMLNLASIDPEEIVVFQDRQGKLKSSNISLRDILTTTTGINEDIKLSYTVDKVPKTGTLKSLLSVLFTTSGKELDDHIKDYKQFRRNVIAKFFGTPISVALSLAEIKTAIDEIATIKNQLENKPPTDTSISDLIEINKKSIENLKKSFDESKTITDAVKDDFPKIAERLDKVKIPHDVANINNIVYVVERSPIFGWIKDTGRYGTNFIVKIKGIYRFTIISPHSFNITSYYTGRDDDTPESNPRITGINTITRIIDRDEMSGPSNTCFFDYEPVASNVVRTTTSYILEYVSDLPQ